MLTYLYFEDVFSSLIYVICCCHTFVKPSSHSITKGSIFLRLKPTVTRPVVTAEVTARLGVVWPPSLGPAGRAPAPCTKGKPHSGHTALVLLSYVHIWLKIKYTDQ